MPIHNTEMVNFSSLVYQTIVEFKKKSGNDIYHTESFMKECAMNVLMKNLGGSMGRAWMWFDVDNIPANAPLSIKTGHFETDLRKDEFFNYFIQEVWNAITTTTKTDDLAKKVDSLTEAISKMSLSEAHEQMESIQLIKKIVDELTNSPD